MKEESLKITLFRIVSASVVSVALASSVFLTMLAPAPLLMIYYFKGLRPYLAANILSLVIFFFIAKILHVPAITSMVTQVFIGILASVVIYSLRASRPFILWRRFHGMLLCLFASILFCGQLVRVSPALQVPLQNWIETNVVKSPQIQSQIKDLKTQLESQEVNYLVDLLSNSEKLKKIFWVEIPQGTIFLLYLAAWINLLIGMRTLRLRNLMPLESDGNLRKSSELLNHPSTVFFKNPDLVLPLIAACLGLIAWHFWRAGIGAETLSWNYWVLNLIAISYFFQGFPLLNLSMQFLGINRGVSSFLIAITIIFSSWLVSLLGFIDHWIDLRSIIVKNLNKNGPDRPVNK
ncbi:MAG: hypothetical protein QE271_03275 [Bacteriovoracaceae bacterium]|nr:hypothetical protein [Bacteriovoracaceae bacterium]